MTIDDVGICACAWQNKIFKGSPRADCSLLAGLGNGVGGDPLVIRFHLCVLGGPRFEMEFRGAYPLRFRFPKTIHTSEN